MTLLNKTIRRVTLDEYGYGRNRRKLVVTLEKGDLITLREQGRRLRHTARLIDVYWWLLRCEADHARMEKLRERKARKAARQPTPDSEPPNGGVFTIRNAQTPIFESRPSTRKSYPRDL
jgi:hypothetical protein